MGHLYSRPSHRAAQVSLASVCLPLMIACEGMESAAESPSPASGSASEVDASSKRYDGAWSTMPSGELSLPDNIPLLDWPEVELVLHVFNNVVAHVQVPGGPIAAVACSTTTS